MVQVRVQVDDVTVAALHLTEHPVRRRTKNGHRRPAGPTTVGPERSLDPRAGPPLSAEAAPPADQAASATTGETRAARRAGSTEESTPAAVAATTTPPTCSHGTSSTTSPDRPNTDVVPSRP
ncbi:hypothetical protein CLV92_101281 [Kineococcus xinjiangensis]|uniref:Uncharacterized protein n=1 Tax=Kineococcus xinjiangensis TaxID=512762 RepID=A0A2S6IW46_9ACTN|nr:hypothetical protein CLV92_101281 [Kineococcus xinjiangensis]